MQVEGPQTPYEVLCRRCRVTFPVGTRQCVHCGGRIGRERLQLTSAAADHEQLVLDEMGEEEAPRGRFLSPFTVLWLVLAVVGTLYRQCA